MSADGQGIKWRKKIAENFNRLGRTNVTDRRQTDGRQHIANVNMTQFAKIIQVTLNYCHRSNDLFLFYTDVGTIVCT